MTGTMVSSSNLYRFHISREQMVYTSMLILIQISARYATNLMDPKDYDKVLSDPKQLADRIYGSKIVIGLEQCMLFSTWGVKVCMMALFWRLTKNLKRLHIYVKVIAVYVAIGLVVITITYYGVYCRPFEQYWAMPVRDMQCATYQHYSITQAVFNISSDAAMLAIPVPLLMKAQMKPMRRVLLFCVMSLGIFTIIAAILNKYFNFASPLTTTYQIWYIREASTAIYVANIVCWWPLLRKLFGFKAFQQSSKRDGRSDGQQKDSSGGSRFACNTPASQSRLSFSLHGALGVNRPDYRKGLRVLSLRHKEESRQSEEAINSVNEDLDFPLEDRMAIHVTDETVVDLEEGLKESGYHAECEFAPDRSSKMSSTCYDTSSRRLSLSKWARK